MKKQTIVLWIGGVVGVLTMGVLRFVGKSTDIFGLLAAMARSSPWPSSSSAT